MYELELQKIREAEFIRRADRERLVRAARLARRDARRTARGSVRQEGERAVSTDRGREHFTHAA